MPYDEATLQRALDIVNGNWDVWQKQVEFDHCDNVPHADVVELIARIVTDIQIQPTEK